MFKKIFMWTIYAMIVGLLIFGAANRTAAKTDQDILFGRSDDVTENGQRRGGREIPNSPANLGMPIKKKILLNMIG